MFVFFHDRKLHEDGSHVCCYSNRVLAKKKKETNQVNDKITSSQLNELLLRNKAALGTFRTISVFL